MGTTIGTRPSAIVGFFDRGYSREFHAESSILGDWMSKFDENLFGRIAVLNDYVTPEQLEECLEVCRSSSSKLHIGRVLLERGYISREQFDRIVALRKKKVRRLLRKPDEAQETDREFGVIARQEGVLGLDALESAVLEQERLKRLNLHFSLSEVLLSRGEIEAAEVLEILAAQGRRVLGCPSCDCHYRVVDFAAGKTYLCTRCESELVQPKFLDSLMVDAVLEDPDGESESSSDGMKAVSVDG